MGENIQRLNAVYLPLYLFTPIFPMTAKIKHCDGSIISHEDNAITRYNNYAEEVKRTKW